MENRITTGKVRFALIVLSVALVLGACRNPFQVGFGDNVDIDRPTVSLDTPSLGSFLRGTVTFSGEASDDVAVASVSISFDRGNSWSATSYRASEQRWSHELNTASRPNGSLSVMVRAIDESGKQTTTEELLFTVDNDPPAIFFTFPAINPDTYDEANPPTIGKNGAVFGTVTVRESIAPEYPKIRFWPAGGGEPDSWTSMRSGDDLPSVFDFRYNIPSDKVGDFRLRVTARDVGGQVRTLPPTGTAGYLVVVVSGAPQIAFTAPQQASYARGNTVVSGTTSHETGNQPDVRVRFSERDAPDALLTVAPGDPGFEITSDGSGGFTWEYELDTTALPNGTIIAQAFAEIGDTTGFDNLVFQVDNAPPTANVTTPGYLDTVYSQVTIAGTASDNMGVDQVAIKLGSDDYLVLSGTYNWQHSFDSITYGTSAHAIEVDPGTGDPAEGTAVWRLPILIRVTDVAGNEHVVDHPIYIDQDLDKPTVTILAPPGGSNLAGPVLVTGTAFDADPGVHRVEMQIIALTDDGETIGHVDPLGEAMDDADWHTATGTTQWNQEINGNGGLYSVTAPGGSYEGSGLTHSGRLRLRIRAVDLGGKEGNVQELAIRLDETIPSITDILPASGSYVRGSFNLTATVTDDEHIESVAVSNDGGTTYHEVYTGGGTTYLLDYPVDTGSGGLNAVSQVRNFRIRVRDNANYTTISTVVLNIDNHWPDGELITTAWDPTEMEGSAFQVRGAAWDRDRGQPDNQFPVRGIDTIDVYFEDLRPGSPTHGEFYHLSGGATTTADLQDLGDGQGAQPVVTSEAHRIRIDRTHIGTVDFKAIEVDGSDSTWWTRVDSTQLPDGPMAVHFLLADRAGNRTHRTDAGFVRNNPPVIDSVTVGTDLDFSGTVEEYERFEYVAAFDARNLLYVSTAASSGNGELSFELETDGSPVLGWPEISGSGVAEGSVDISGLPDTDGITPRVYTLRVSDTVGIVAVTEISVHVQQTDSTAPTATITPMTQADAEAISAGGDGHVDFITGPHPYTPNLPKVSGMVRLTGTAGDDQRIRSIHLTLPGAARTEVAQWNSSVTPYKLESLDPAFEIISGSLSADGGHQIEWRYSWDTSTVPNSVGLDLNVTVDVEDFRAGSPPPASASRRYDVVPYVVSVSTPNPAMGGIKQQNIRSSSGAYSILSGNTPGYIRLEGFNLRPITSGVRVTHSSQPSGLSGGMLAGAALSFTAPAAPYTELLVANDGTGSGHLTVVGGTPALPIPSINNLNDNDLPQNREPDPFFTKNALLTDDRYVRFVQVVSTGFSNGYYPAMLMDEDVPIFGYVDSSAADDLQVRRGRSHPTIPGNFDEPLIRGTTWDQMAIARDDDGRYFQVSIHNRLYGQMALLYDRYASLYAGNRGAARPYWANYTGNFYDAANNNALTLESTQFAPGLLINRYRNPQLVVTGASDTPGTAASVYLAYFDAAPGRIVVRSLQIGRSVSGTGSNLHTGGEYAGVQANMTDVAYTTDNPTTNGANTRHVLDETASQYFDLLITSDSRIVLVYYDETTSRLRIATSSTPITGENPAETITFAPSRAISDIYVGTHVSATIDEFDGIHIAAHDSSTAGLRYLHLADHTDTTPLDVAIDTNFSVGIWTEIRLNNGRPYIAYYNNSENGTRDSIKLAWLPVVPANYKDITEGVDGSGFVTGTWEYMTVPTLTVPQGGIPQFRRVNLGFSTTDDVLVGYLGAAIEYARLLPEVNP